MFTNKKIKFKISSNNLKYYKNEYNVKIDDILEIQQSEIKHSCKIEIEIKCNNCGKIESRCYDSILKSGYTPKYTLCKKCCSIKHNQEKYGVDNVFQLDSIKNKSKKTIQRKYGCDNVSQNSEIQQKKVETSRERYGTDHPLQNKTIFEKQTKTMQERYGVDNTSKLDKIKEKKDNTFFKNFGVHSIYHSPITLEKIKKTNLEKYGKEFNLQSDYVKNKIKATNLLIYGYVYPAQNQKIKEKLSFSNKNTLNNKTYENDKNIIKINNDHTFECKCDLGKDHIYTIDRILYYSRRAAKTVMCTICNPIDKHTSGLEMQLCEFIKNNYDGEILENDRTVLNGQELDIYLPELKLAFEFNGVYWHNELNKPDNYHKTKSDICEKLGIQLIHIWEDDWIYKQNIINSMILNKLGKTTERIFARKTIIKEVDNKTTKEFLNNNHIQGYSSSSIKLGLYYNDELVSLMTFKENNRLKMIELNRFCNKLNTNVIGGASKLFNYFLNHYNNIEIVSYADRCYSNGGLYNTLGFYLDNISKPSYYYVIDGIRKHKSNFSVKKLHKQGFNGTEHEIMLERKIYRVYNSGNYKYIFKR